MSDNTKLKISNGLNEDKYSVKSKFVNFFLLAIFTLFPLFYTDYYYNIRHDKYYFFLVVTAVLVLMIGAVAITNSDSQSRTKNKAESVPWYKKLSFTDYAFGHSFWYAPYPLFFLKILPMLSWVLAEGTMVYC